MNLIWVHGVIGWGYFILLSWVRRAAKDPSSPHPLSHLNNPPPPPLAASHQLPPPSPLGLRSPHISRSSWRGSPWAPSGS